MGRGGNQTAATQQTYSWDEVKQHTTREDRWLVIDGKIYDISRWATKHPGGSRVIGHYSGQDATEAFRAFHNDPVFVGKYLKPLCVGRLENDPKSPAEKDRELREDFEQLRQTATKAGYFHPSICFYVAHLLHLIVLEVMAYLVLRYWGTDWLPYIVAVALYTVVQAQASWTQHDYGHLSVFNSRRLNHILHLFTMNFTKGAASHWWNHLHFQHHAKPNVVNKDPDVRLENLFVLGEEMPKKMAKERKRSLPYNWQQHYFFATLPPLLFPIYFQIMIFRHTITRRQWLDLLVTSTFYLKILLLYSPMLGVWGAIKYYLLVRCMESHWFVWVSQSNHIPMEIAEDKERPWVPLQLHATCDIEKSPFNDWFTGHLNFQIEHHLFPTMPRHNLYKVAPLVKSLCRKHNIPYVTKTLWGAFSDIVKSLKSSGELWEHYYQAYQLA